jgi:hypothetical protein
VETAHAQAIAERLHAAEHDGDGTPLLSHVRRVVRATPTDARALAWLHESFETGSISEQKLLMEGLTTDELRALRLLALPQGAHSDAVYLAYIELIARALGRAGEIARAVKVADLRDRVRHPRVRSSGWTPPYARALGRLLADELSVPVPTLSPR